MNIQVEVKKMAGKLLLLGVALVGLAAAPGHSAPAKKAGPRIYRIILPVGDIERAAKFYTELLGIEGMRVSAGRHYFDCGGVLLALFDAKADGDTGEAPHPNYEHVYFAVKDLEAVFGRAERLGGLSDEIGDGGQPMGEIATRPWGERSFYLKDPFGNPLCFVDETTLFTGE